MCGLFACVGTYSEPRSRRKRRANGRCNFWRRPWRLFRRGGHRAAESEPSRTAVVQTMCYDTAQVMMSSDIESVMRQKTTIDDSTTICALRTPTTPLSQSPAIPLESVTLDFTQIAVSETSNETEPSSDRSTDSSTPSLPRVSILECSK